MEESWFIRDVLWVSALYSYQRNGFLYNLRQSGFDSSDNLIGQMFMVRKTHQIGKMRGVIIAECKGLIAVLTVIAIPQGLQFASRNNYCFADFQ
jgi:hypothetical protein